MLLSKKKEQLLIPAVTRIFLKGVVLNAKKPTTKAAHLMVLLA
jgi:hypothetical protein